MTKAAAASIVMLGLLFLPTAKGQGAGHVVLPNTNLLPCQPSACSQLWPADVDPKSIFPRQLILDSDHGCIYGMTALYDKTVPFDLVKSALDDSYGQWAVKELDKPALQAYIWRVPQKFVIEISVADKQDEKRHWAEAGAERVIFIAIGAKNACTPSSK